jgi:hypothetical protein
LSRGQNQVEPHGSGRRHSLPFSIGKEIVCRGDLLVHAAAAIVIIGRIPLLSGMYPNRAIKPKSDG